ncbi:MAG: glycosyltransferase family 4 protein [Clostridiales bacterium]|nr:glycosyltransferase family 4 protein [Clostridiales bacterium]
MKVLLVNKFHYKKGGSETYYFTLAEALKARGHEVIFFSMKDPERNLPCEQEKYFVSNASVGGALKSKINMVTRMAYSKEAYRNITQLLKDEKPDLVMLNNIHRQITLSVIDAVKDFDSKLPIFWTMHDFATACPAYTMLDGAGKICERCLDGDFGHCVDNRCMKGSKLMSMLVKYEADFIRRKRLYDKVDLYICPSEFIMRMLQHAGFTKREIVMMRNPLPMDTQYKLSDTTGDYVLYFGRLSEEKGVRVLIDAVSKVGCRLEIVGTGPLEDELKDYVKRAGAKGVTFRGFQTGRALTDYVAGSRCVVVPSVWYENGPYNVMEAMAIGKPLIVSHYGGLPELVEHGKNGYVYHAADGNAADALADHIRKMFALTEDEYAGMARSSLEKAKEMFDAEQYVVGIEKFYSMSNNMGRQC